MNAVKVSTTLSAEEKKKQTLIAQQEKDADLYRTHFAYPAALSLYLNQNQIEAVKDGLTYGVLMVTYNATLDMIPTLKVEEKKQIYVWLVEARELAMDAESSNKKHENWYKRIEERKKVKQE